MAARDLDMGKHEFLDWWRATVHEAALMVHQADQDWGAREQLKVVSCLVLGGRGLMVVSAEG
jgi:hypothetical protein